MRDRIFAKRAHGVVAASLFAATCLGVATVHAQGPGGPGGPGGPRGFGRGPRAATLADVPATALAAALKLSEEQTTRIAAIQERLQQQRQELRPRRGPGGPGPDENGAPPPPPDPEAMRAVMDQMRALEQNAVRDIRAVLSDAQKQALPDALKEMDDLRAAGIPLDIAADLNLTSDQKTRIAAIAQTARQAMRRQQNGADLRREDFDAMREAMRQAREKTREQVQAVLTEAQRAQLAKYLSEHPQRGPGGPGGPGGFRGGRGRGPEGGPGGPPPF